MAVNVELHYHKSFPSSRDATKTQEYLTDWKKHIPGNFPGVEKFEAVEPLVYRWTFTKVGHGGYEYQLKMMTRFAPQNGEVRIINVPEPGNAKLEGTWKLSNEAGKTQVTFDVKMA